MKCWGTLIHLVLVGLMVLTAAATRAELPTREALEETLRHLSQKHSLPSLSAAIRNDDGVVAAAAGLADVDNNIPQSTLLGMPGGSTGKSFVAATAIKLVEDHAIELSDPISLYVGQQSWFRALTGAEKITIEHLLTHTSGIPDHVDDFDFAWDLFWRRIQGDSNLYQPHELIEFVLDDGLLFEPGDGFSYSDTGYLVLGLVLESATDLAFYELLERTILEPHNLPARPAKTDTMADVSQGYVDWSVFSWLGGFSGPVFVDGIMRLHPRTEWTGGGLVTTPSILTDFYHKLARGEIVSQQSYQNMLSAGIRVDGQDWHYGHGLYVGTNSAGHGGWFPGYRTNARHYSDLGITIAVQTNTDADFDQSAVMQALLSQITP